MRKTRLYNLWVTMLGSFWFIPVLMIAASICLSIISLWLDHKLEHEVLIQSLRAGKSSFSEIMLTVGPEGGRAVLTAIAGSMITVAGVTFSITIVALTLASSQFGPRLLRSFIQDKRNQFVLGSFNATFVYCLLILRSILSGSGSQFVPTISVNIAVLLAILNVVILVFFIHHISTSITAESVIHSVYESLIYDVDRIFKDIATGNLNKPAENQKACVKNSDSAYAETKTLKSTEDGYVQAIDYQQLIDLSRHHGLLIDLHIRAGNFSVAGSQIAEIKSDTTLEDKLLNELCSAFIYGRQRTPEQDVEYAIHQMVEVAVRSLSPGINDPFTALTCIDYLSSILCNLVHKKLPGPNCYDADGTLRLVIKPVAFEDLLDSAFNQIRQHSHSSVAVMIRLMESYGCIAECLENDAHKQALAHHIEMLKNASLNHLAEKKDIEDMESRYAKCIAGVSPLRPEKIN